MTVSCDQTCRPRRSHDYRASCAFARKSAPGRQANSGDEEVVLRRVHRKLYTHRRLAGIMSLADEYQLVLSERDEDVDVFQISGQP